MKNIKQDLAHFQEAKETLLEVILTYIKKESGHSYEDRLEVYLDACEKDILPIDNHYHHFDGVNWDKHTLFDDFYCERYATFHVDTLQNYGDYEDITDIRAAYEYFMDKGIAGFINNW